MNGERCVSKSKKIIEIKLNQSGFESPLLQETYLPSNNKF